MGTPLMEVFKIVYMGRDKVEPSNQLGTIKLSFDDSVLYLYKVDKIDTTRPTIEYMDEIPLDFKSPPVDIAHVDIEVDLFNGAYKGSFNLDYEADDDSYRTESRESRIRSRHGFGEIAIVYGLFNQGAVANLEVKLLDCAANANVYGVVAASNSILTSHACLTMLFANKPDNETQVGEHGLIPLSRSWVGVPMCCKLYVLISLHCDQVEYKARLEFDAKTRGKDVEFSEFNYPQSNKPRIQVNVTWNIKHKAIKSLYDIPGTLSDSDSDFDLSDDGEDSMSLHFVALSNCGASLWLIVMLKTVLADILQSNLVSAELCFDACCLMNLLNLNHAEGWIMFFVAKATV